MRERWASRAGAGLTAAAVLSLPIWLRNPYDLHLAITIAMFSIAALGARLLLLVGLWSFGQGVFLTLGAYASALLVVDHGMSFWAVLPLAAVVGAGAAAAVGVPAMRLRGASFAIFTMVLVFALQETIIVAPGITHGESGFVGVPPPGGLTSRASLYTIVAVLLLLAMAVMHRIEHSRLGSVLAAIRQSDVLAESVGINLTRYRIGAFVVGAFFTTAAGAFSAAYYGAAQPDIWGLWPSIFIITYAIIGGVGSVFGPIVGATFGVVIVEAFRSTEGLQGVLLGAALIVVMFVLPGGLTSVASRETLERIRRLP